MVMAALNITTMQVLANQSTFSLLEYYYARTEFI